MELQKIKNTISFLKDLQGICIKEYSHLKEESKSLNLTNESSFLVTSWIDGMQVILVLLRFIRYGDSLDCSIYILTFIFIPSKLSALFKVIPKNSKSKSIEVNVLKANTLQSN
jgi:hypothetical protein